MKIVKEIPPSQRTRQKSSLYDKFFDGQVWQIDASDFPHTSLVTIRATLIRRAHRKGLTLKTSLRQDSLFVQVVPEQATSA